jgi:hypothetical protein
MPRAMPLLLGGAIAGLLLMASATLARAGGSATISIDMDPSAPGVQTTATHAAGSAPIAIDVVIEDGGPVAAFEFGFSFDVISIELLGWAPGPFLSSTGRTMSCQEIRTENTERIGCTTSGAAPPPATGDGVLATIFVRPRFSGTTCLNVLIAETADVDGQSLPTSGAGACLDVLETTATPTPTSSASVSPTPVFAGAIISVDTDPSAPGIQNLSTYSSGATQIDVDVVVTNADHAGAFEFLLYFDAGLLEFLGWTVGPFITSTGRVATCEEIITENSVRIGCTTAGPAPPEGASGDGVLAHLRFRPLQAGTVCLSTLLVETAEIFGHPLPTIGQSGCLQFEGTPTPSPTTTAVPGVEKMPESCGAPLGPFGDDPDNCDGAVPSANLWICIVGPCSGPGEGNLVIFEYARDVQTGDFDGDTIIDGLGAYEFQVEFDNFVIQSVNPVDVVFQPSGSLSPYPGGADGVTDGEGATRAPSTCSFSLVQENRVRFGCVTSGDQPAGPTGDFDLARLNLVPHPDLANDIFPGNDNGVVTVLKDNGCELADVFGHPVAGTINGGLTPNCGDLAVTVRILEADMNLDCVVDVQDQQLISYRYGSFFGSTLYSAWYDLEPNLHDLDIDIKDIQKVFGRDGSTCQDPIPWQPPLPPPAPFG